MIEVDEIVCQELVELATDYLEGTLASERRALLEEHLAVCDACGIYVDQLREAIRLSRDPARLELDPARRAELLTAFRASAGGGPRRAPS